MRPTPSLLALSLLTLLPSPSPAAIDTAVSYGTEQRDQLTGAPDYEQETKEDTQANFGPGQSSVSGDLNTTYQKHSFYSAMGAFINGPYDVALAGTRTHSLEMWGIRYGPQKWHNSSTLFIGTANFSDRITPQPTTPGGPVGEWMDFYWRLNGFYTHSLDLDTGENPLYRLLDHLTFKADGNGAEEEPINVDVKLYDPDAPSQNPPMWGLLRNDVSNENLPVPNLVDRVEVLSVRIQRDAQGRVLPVEIDNSVRIETSHEFLNDGAAFNYNLKGNLLYSFQQSADLLGVIVRDANGNPLTDVTLLSEEGVNYTLLIPEPVTLPLLLLTTPLLRRRPPRP